MKTARPIVLENKYLKYVIGPDGANLNFIDKITCTDYVSQNSASAFISLKRNGTTHSPSRCFSDNGKIIAEFDRIEARIFVGIIQKEHYLVFEILSVSGSGIDEVTMPEISFNMPGFDQGIVLNLIKNDKFAVSLLALNLKVNVTPVADTSVQFIGREPFKNTNPKLSATSYPRFGIEGAKTALAACPREEMRFVIQEIVREEKLPSSSLGGAWALEAPELRGSYLFSGNPEGGMENWLTEENADEWILLAKNAGMDAIFIYNGRNDWYGHYIPNPKLFPHGLDGMKNVIDKIHAAGLKAGMHTATGCICKDDPWVSPVPDRRLAKDACFTLAEPLTEGCTTIFTAEAPGDLPRESGYFIAGGTDLVIDDEIITYHGISNEPPFGFTGCERGARSTNPARHELNAKLIHLTERYSLYLPDGESSLLEEIASNIARTVNYCGLDMLYLDGAEAMGVNGHGWHYIAKIKLAVMSRLERPVIMESACANHHSWHLRSRLGAWDACHRGHKRYIDRHLQENMRYMNNLLPTQLGWWEIHGGGSGIEALKPDEIEYLCLKCLAYDMPVSLIGVSPLVMRKNPLRKHLLDIIGKYEKLRCNAYFPESVRQKLRMPGAEFKLECSGDEKWELTPLSYVEHKIGSLEDRAWTVDNELDTQPFKCRIQALNSVSAYDDPDNLLLLEAENFTDTPYEEADPVNGENDCMNFRFGQAADGISRKIEKRTEEGKSICRYIAENASSQSAWARIAKEFSSPVNLSENSALGVWIHGDGKGEILNFQLAGRDLMGLADHYVKIDYKGWKYHELVEPEGSNAFDYSWPYSLLSVTRGEIPYNSISTLNIYYNNIKSGGTAECLIGNVKALKTFSPLQKNPSITVGKATLRFPVEMNAGDWLEFSSMSDCKFYRNNGAFVCNITPEGNAPVLLNGENSIVFNPGPEGPEKARTKITITKMDSPLK